MIEFIVTGIVSCLLFYFILYFHESGHAFFAIIFTKCEVKIRLGGSVDKKIFKIGRLIICLNGVSPWYGTVHWSNESLSNIKRAFICLGGPIFSILLSFILWWLIKVSAFRYVNKDALKFIFVHSIWQFIITITPIKYTRFFRAYEGMYSDGLNALNILLKK
jgi:hypothetical protein